MGMWERLINKYYYRDTYPYESPHSLDDLRGPARGTVTLPSYTYSQPSPISITAEAWAEEHPGMVVFTGTQSTFTLNDLQDTTYGYFALLTRGRLSDQIALINRDRLVAIWAEINVPLRVEKIWRRKFRELRSSPMPRGLPRPPGNDTDENSFIAYSELGPT